MKIFYSDLHKHQAGNAELTDGQLVPCHEHPGRMQSIRSALQNSSHQWIEEIDDFGLDPIKKVHDQDYIEFLNSAWSEWTPLHGEVDALPLVWPVRSLRQTRPQHIDGLISYYAMDAGTPITAGTWTAITAGVNVTLQAQASVFYEDEPAFALCRPPGHHASKNVYGGYCFFNNAAIAAQKFIDDGLGKVAVLDIDYHHGNGTQDIFYDRSDVLFVSIHADPQWEFPFFLGHKEETGEGDGQGFNVNLPLPLKTTYQQWRETLMQAIDKIQAYGAEALVVSLGVDTYENDPISNFLLKSEDYLEVGELLAQMQIPTLFVMEGGYDVDAIGMNVLNVLNGFDSVTNRV